MPYKLMYCITRYEKSRRKLVIEDLFFVCSLLIYPIARFVYEGSVWHIYCVAK